MIGRSHGSERAVPSLSHTEAEALISARLEAPLSARQEQGLAAHLAQCHACSKFAAQMNAMRAGIHALPRLPASPIVSRQVRERISQPASFWDRLGGLMGGRVGFAPMAATVAMLILVLGGYALFRDDGNNGRLGPTISAGTQIALNATATSSADSVTQTTSNSDVPPGEILPTDVPTELPNVRGIDAEPTATESTSTLLAATDEPPTPTATDGPTQAPTATSEPTDEPTATTEPSATNTPRPKPTGTPESTATTEPTAEPTATNTATAEPTATNTATAEPTATHTPTDQPRPTRTPTPEPTATEEPTREPTATERPTKEPTATERPTREPTATEKPTREPTATEEPVPEQPTIAPAGDEGNDEPPPADEPPVEPPTEVETPDEGPVIEPVEGTVEDEATDAVEPTADEQATGEAASEPQGDNQTDVAPLDDTRRITGLTSGGAPAGPLRINAPGTLMILSSDPAGSDLQVVSMEDGSVVANLGTGANPIWSPLGMLVLYQSFTDGAPAAALYDGETGEVLTISDPAAEGAVQDIPAGWSGTAAYYLRETGDEASTVVLYAYDVNTGETTTVWTSEGVALSPGRPIPTGEGFLIATTQSWLLIGIDGSESNLGPNDYGLTGEGFLSPFASLVAYPAGGQIIVADISTPGIAIGQPLPYVDGVGSGFTWSPDGFHIAVSDGASLQIYDTAGNFAGAAASAVGATIAAPQWLADGIYYVELNPTPSLRRLLEAVITGFNP